MGTKLYAYDKDDTVFRDINSAYISGTKASGVGWYGLLTANYHPGRSYTPISGATAIAKTGDAIYTEPYENKTFYISAGNFATIVPGSGMVVNIEGSHSRTGGWYNKWKHFINRERFYYSSTSDYHSYMRVRISGMKSGATGAHMINVSLQG